MPRVTMQDTGVHLALPVSFVGIGGMARVIVRALRWQAQRKTRRQS